MRHEILLNQIEDFCEKTGMGETTLARKAKIYPQIVQRLRGGHSILVKTEERLTAFMRDYCPDAPQNRSAS